MNKVYFLRPQFTKGGDTVYRSVIIASDDLQAHIKWLALHREGREATKAGFGVRRLAWNDPAKKRIADFPSSGEPGGIFSARAVEVLKEMLEANGDIYPLSFDEEGIAYLLFDCWANIAAKPNEGFNMFRAGSLKAIMVEESVLPDIFLVDGLPGLIVSERFKIAAEHAGLTGMQFSGVEIIWERKR